MASNRALTPRGSPLAFGAHLLLTLLTLCLIFEILRLLTFTSATPINHLAQRGDDSGPDGPSTYYDIIDTTVKTSGNPKRDFHDRLNSAFEDLGNTTKSIFDPDLDLDKNSKRDVVESFKGAFDDLGNTIKSIFHPSDKKDTPVEAVSEYAYEQLNHQIPLKDLKEAFKKTYGKMKHSGNKQADDEEWIADQVENVIPELKKKYDEANKSTSASKRDERDNGEGFKTIMKDFGIKIRANFVYEGENMPAVDWISQCAYDKFNHYISLEELKDRFEKSHEAMGQKDNQTADAEWINDEIDHEFPKLKEIYKARKTDIASKNHERDAGDKPRPMPGTSAYYFDPSFFPYPMPPTPNITNELKTSLGDAFNNWRTGNVTEDADKNCTSGLATCNKADAITTKVDWTPKKERQKVVEACIQSLIEDPSCFVKYRSTNVLKPYLTELVDTGKIKDADGKIKKFYKRGQIKPGVYDAPKPVLSQNFLDILTTAYKKYKEDLANHSDMSCPLTTDNVCENPGLASNSIGPHAPSHDERQQMLETCIVFISWHPNCLQRYETKDFIKPHLQELADSGKIEGYAPNSSASGNSTGSVLQAIANTLFGAGTVNVAPANNESATPDAHDTSNATVQARDGVLVDPQEENEKALAQWCNGKKPTGICANV
jgi:hypothetical protein